MLLIIFGELCAPYCRECSWISETGTKLNTLSLYITSLKLCICVDIVHQSVSITRSVNLDSLEGDNIEAKPCIALP